MRSFAFTSEPAVAEPSREATAGLDSNRIILVADIGATTSHLAVFDSSDGRLLRVQCFRTREHHGVAELVARFLRTMPGARIDSARVVLNVPWPVYAHELAEVFEIPSVVVVDG